MYWDLFTSNTWSIFPFFYTILSQCIIWRSWSRCIRQLSTRPTMKSSSKNFYFDLWQSQIYTKMSHNKECSGQLRSMAEPNWKHNKSVNGCKLSWNVSAKEFINLELFSFPFNGVAMKSRITSRQLFLLCKWHTKYRYSRSGRFADR